MKRHNFQSEAELAARLVSYLSADERKRVYQEVGLDGRHADLVVVQDDCVTVIECKLSLEMTAVKQARRWIDDAHRVAVCVPYHYDVEERCLCAELCFKFDIGLFMVGDIVTYNLQYIDEKGQSHIVAGKYNPIASTRLIDHLAIHGSEYQSGKFAKAGTNTGNRLNPQNIALHELREVVEQNPGIRLAHALAYIKHPWGTNGRASNQITKLLRSGIEGIEPQIEGGITMLYPTLKGATR